MKILQDKLNKIAIASIIVGKAADRHELTNTLLDNQLRDFKKAFKRKDEDEIGYHEAEFAYQKKSVSFLTLFLNNNKNFMNTLRANFILLGKPKEITFLLQKLATEQCELKGFIRKRDQLLNTAFLNIQQ